MNIMRIDDSSLLKRDYYYRAMLSALVWCLLVFGMQTASADEAEGYLYYREITIAPYQNMREFFDLPDRRGHYDIIVVSEAMTPLTVHLIRLTGEKEKSFAQKRSFRLGRHRFEFHFTNEDAENDLAIEVANSNPTMKVTVSMAIVEEEKAD